MAGGAPFRAHCAVPTAEQMQTEQMEQVAVPARVRCSGKSASLPEHLPAHRVYLLYCVQMTHITSWENTKWKQERVWDCTGCSRCVKVAERLIHSPTGWESPTCERQHRSYGNPRILMQASRNHCSARDNTAKFTDKLMLTFLTFHWKQSKALRPRLQ